MDQLHLELKVDELTFDEMIDIQEGNLRKAKTILVKCATDGNGRPLDEEVAADLIGKLNIAQMRAVFAEFGERVQAAMQETLPKAPAPKSRPR